MATFFDRIGRVEIISGTKVIYSTANGTATVNVVGSSLRALDDIDFKFECKKVCDMTTFQNYANVSILGLSRETIQFLATYRNMAEELKSQKRVRIFASYKDWGDNLIFDGDITLAKPSIPPENWLNIEANVNNERGEELYSKSFIKRIRFHEAVEALARDMGLKNVQWKNCDEEDGIAEKRKEIAPFAILGTKAQIIKELGRMSNFIVFEDCGSLMLQFDENKPFTSYSGMPVTISEENGMIGVPQVKTGIGQSGDNNQKFGIVEVKTFINPSIRMWDIVNLKSVYLPDMNGLYSVSQIEYNGHFRGQEWYQTMTLVKALQKG